MSKSTGQPTATSSADPVRASTPLDRAVTWASYVALGIILLIGAYLRLAHLDLAEFKRDEAANVLMALDLVDDRRLPLVGLDTSVPGLANGPVFVYLIAIPLAIARDPQFATAFVGLLNIAALYVLYLVVARVWGRAPALTATALYAVGSWAVLFSRKLWPNEAMPLFSVLLAFALIQLVEGKQRSLILAGAWLAVLVNLHPSGLMFVPVVLAAMVFRLDVVRSRAAVGAIAVGILVSLPLLLHEIRSGFNGLRALRAVGSQAAQFDLSSFHNTLTLIGPDAWGLMAGEIRPEFDAASLPAGGIGVASAIFLVLGVGIASTILLRHWRARHQATSSAIPVAWDWRPTAVLLLWLILPLALSARRSLPAEPHYLIPLFPAFLAFLGLGVAGFVGAFRRTPSPAPRLVATSLAAGFCVWSAVVQIQHFEQFMQIERAAGARTLVGVPLERYRAALARGLELAKGAPITVVTQGKFDGEDPLPAIMTALAPRNTPLRFADGGGNVVVPAQPGLFVVAPSADPVANHLLAGLGRPAEPPVSVPGSNRDFRFYLTGAQQPPATSSAIVRLENGLTLEEIQVPPSLAPGATVNVVTRWRVPRTSSGELAFFFHLVDDRQQSLVGRDRAGLHMDELRVGDLVLIWATLDVPPSALPGRYWINFGAYGAQDRQRISMTDAAGAPLGDSKRLGPYKIPVSGGRTAAGFATARFNDSIALVGAAVQGQNTRQPVQVRPGEAVEVRLDWRSDRAPTRDYSVFVHLIDEKGQVVTQHDGWPVDGRYPTTIWDAGEVVPDLHRIALPPNVSTGRLRVVAGLYDAATLKRLARADGPGEEVAVGELVLG